jgi:hypothetical protein
MSAREQIHAVAILAYVYTRYLLCGDEVTYMSELDCCMNRNFDPEIQQNTSECYCGQQQERFPQENLIIT